MAMEFVNPRIATTGKMLMSRFQLPTAVAALLFTVWVPGVVGAESIPVVPPEQEQAAVRVGSDSASEGVTSASLPADPVSEVLRLRDELRANRDRIEGLRSSDLERAEEAYRSALVSIAPKDMFETDAEHREREARERSEAATQKAKSESEIHRKYDALLSEEVEPFYQRVRSLLSETEVVPHDAIKAHLEKYDPEHGLFIGGLEINSDLIDTAAQLIVPMKRDDARTFWKNRGSLVGRMMLSMDIHSLDIDIEDFWFENPQSARRTKEKALIIDIRRPTSGGRLDQGSPSEDQLKRSKRLRTSAEGLAKRSAKGASDNDFLGEHARAVKGWISEYNRLVGETQSIFGKDPHIQALKMLAYTGSNSQAAGAVTTASKGLQAYLASFVSHDAFRASAEALAERSAKGASDSDSLGHHARAVKGWISEYNRLVGETQSVFGKDPHIQALKMLTYTGSNSQAAGAVTTASKGLQAYLASFVSHDAFRASAEALAKRSAKGASDNDFLGEHARAVKGWISEYNRLVGETQSIFGKDPHIQALKMLAYTGSNSQAAGAVTTASKGLQAYLASFVSHDAFRASAEALAERSAKGASDSDSLGHPGMILVRCEDDRIVSGGLVGDGEERVASGVGRMRSGPMGFRSALVGLRMRAGGRGARTGPLARSRRDAPHGGGRGASQRLGGSRSCRTAS